MGCLINLKIHGKELDMLGVVIAFVVGLILGLLLAWFYCRQRISEHEAQIHSLQASLKEKEREEAIRAAEPQVPVTKPDNLERIEGIGPKISAVLQAAGITTFAQLAATDVSRLKQILGDAGLTLADPSTWPKQAELAAAGDWKTLEALQDELKGGRRA
jgi:predicted flap endonuclease-1-like 5' DNA nuclease